MNAPVTHVWLREGHINGSSKTRSSFCAAKNEMVGFHFFAGRNFTTGSDKSWRLRESTNLFPRVKDNCPSFMKVENWTQGT